MEKTKELLANLISSIDQSIELLQNSKVDLIDIYEINNDMSRWYDTKRFTFHKERYTVFKATDLFITKEIVGWK